MKHNASPTGKMIATGPNIQNIPIHTKEGDEIRKIVKQLFEKDGRYHFYTR